MSRRKHRHLKSPRSLTVASALRSHSGCYNLSTPVPFVPWQSGILSTPVPFVPWPWWQLGLPFPRYNLALKIQGQRSRSKVPQSAQHPADSYPLCFISKHPIDSRPFRSMTIGPPIPEIEFDLENSRSRSSWLISFVFHIMDILSTLVTFVPWQSGLPFLRYHLTLKILGQRSRSKVKVQLTHFLCVSPQGILSTLVPFVPWQSGLPFLRYNLTLKIQGQRSRSKVPKSA